MAYLPITPIIMSWNSIYELPKNTAVYENNFPTPIILDPNHTYGIAIESIDTYYSFPNIKEGVNNVFTYTKNAVETILHLPTGCYDISTINSTVKDLLGADANEITISSVIPQLKSNITIGANFTVDFTKPNSVNEILGFDAKILNAGSHVSDEIVNINKTNSIFVNCDLISESYVNGLMSPVIYTFFPNVAPGYKIVKELPRLDFLKINRTQINTIKVWLTDQNGDYLDLRGETVTVRFYLGKLIYN